MPMRPRSGSAFEVRQRKLWSSSSDGRLLEREHLDALRVHAGHHVLDRRVLAGGVHRLQDHEDRVAVARPQQLLCVGELLDATRDGVLRPLLELVRREGRELRAARPTRVSVGDARRWPGSTTSCWRSLVCVSTGLPLVVGRPAVSYHHAVAAGDPTRTTRLLVRAR